MLSPLFGSFRGLEPRRLPLSRANSAFIQAKEGCPEAQEAWKQMERRRKKKKEVSKGNTTKSDGYRRSSENENFVLSWPGVAKKPCKLKKKGNSLCAFDALLRRRLSARSPCVFEKERGARRGEVSKSRRERKREREGRGESEREGPHAALLLYFRANDASRQSRSPKRPQVGEAVRASNRLPDNCDHLANSPSATLSSRSSTRNRPAWVRAAFGG